MPRQELRFDPAFPVIAFSYEIPKDLGDLHYHDCLEIALICEGRGVFYVEGKKFPFQAGDLFLLNRFEGHRARATSASPCRGDFLYLGDLFLKELLPFAPEADFLRLLSLGGREFVNRFRDDEVARSLSAGFEATERGGATGRTLARLRWGEMLVHLAERFRSRLAPLRSDAFAERLPDLFLHLRERLGTPLDATTVAERMGLSEAHFRKRFKAYTGLSLREWVEERRLIQARFLLESKGTAVRDVAEETGFRDLSAFHRRFLRRFGVTPAEARREAGR